MNLSILLLLLIFGISYTTCITVNTNTNVANNCVGSNQTEYNALMAIYTSTNGEHWVITPIGEKNNWNKTSNYCDWVGVLCNCYGSTIPMPPNAVLAISIRGSNLVGTLPNELANLSYLLFLDVSNNMGLTGTIPDISNLVMFQGLNVGNTGMNGVIKPGMFNKMQNLFALTLGPSSLTGDIGNFYNNCSLQVLEIGCTQINSVDLSNCNNLEQLDVGNSPITQISKDPSTVCGFNNLIILYLQNTKLDSNSINLYCLNKLSNLQVLDISYNSFSGAAPTLNQAIYQVFMSNNNFNSIPNMANCKNITYIDFSYNKITTVSGLLPPMVNTILLNNNNIADNIDNFVWSASVAIFVNISNNNFHGYVKAQYPSKLQTLDARYNVKITESPVISTNCKIEWDYTMLYLIKDSDNNSWLCPTGIVTHNNLLYCWDPTRYRIYVDPVFSNYQACNELTK